MGDINSPQSAWGAPSGADAQHTSPGRSEGAILTKYPNLLNRLLLTRSGSLSESASQTSVLLALSPAPMEETHFSRLCWSSNSFFFFFPSTRQLRSCTVLPVNLLFPSLFTSDQVVGISVGCQWDAELQVMQLMSKYSVTSKIPHVSNSCWLKLWVTDAVAASSALPMFS